MGGTIAGISALWLGVFLSIVFLSLLPSTTPASQIGSAWLWNLGHVPAYAALTVVTLSVVGRCAPLTQRRRILVGASVMLFAVGLELLQPFVGRTASLTDTAFTLLGVIAGMKWQQLTAKQNDLRREKNGFH